VGDDISAVGLGEGDADLVYVRGYRRPPAYPSRVRRHPASPSKMGIFKLTMGPTLRMGLSSRWNCYVQKRKRPISQGRSPEQSPRNCSGDRLDPTLRVVNGTGGSGTNWPRESGPRMGVIGRSVELPIMSCMDWDTRDRVEALRREIAELQRLNLAYWQMPRPHPVAMHDHERREQRLREIMDELKSMTEWKRP
jgi:hypothetical protein